MSRKKLKIKFIDTWDACIQFFVETLDNRFDVEITNDAEYILFCDETFGQSNKDYNKNDVIKIFYTGENRRPYMSQLLWRMREKWCD